MYPKDTRELMVGYFRIVGTGAQAAEPIEKIVATASEAEFQRMTFQRLCGKFGTVEVMRKDGRAIRPERLQQLVREETSGKINPTV